MSELIDSILEDEVVRILQDDGVRINTSQMSERVINRFAIEDDAATFNGVWNLINDMVESGRIVRHFNGTLGLMK